MHFLPISNKILSLAGAIVLSVSLVGTGSAHAEENLETDIYAISWGGKIYDNWMSALEVDKPEQTHPSYPANGQKSGAATWRCKECHGWDYKGKDGAYSTGSHFTGITGIRKWAGRNSKDFLLILRDKTHQYSKTMISDRAAYRLAKFVTQGQIDMDQYIDHDTKKPYGDASQGARFFQTVCYVCHGLDGAAINFKQDPDVEYIGTVGSKNPWETLHKIRNGQPGAVMPSLGALSLQDQLDILAYTQTLPVK